MRQPSRERGQALLIFVLGILGLVGAVALAVDGGNALAERRRAQNAADAAALAGAAERVHNNTPSWVQAAYASAAQNGYNNDGVTNVVRVYSPPVSGPYAGNIEYIQVQITSYTRTYFASVLGIPRIENATQAVARTKTPQYQPMFGGAAVVSLAPISDCNNYKAFWVHAEATLDISGGGVFVNSDHPTCALIQQGNGSIRIQGPYLIQIVGGASIQKPKLLTPYPPMTNAAPIPYPPPIYMPKVGCGDREAKILPDGHTMSAGNWGDDFPPEDVDTLEKGIYCLGGDFILNDNQRLEGSGVVFKIEHGRVRFSGNARINLSAPRKGDLAGLLIYQPIENKNLMVLNANEDSSFVGAILAPGALIRFKGNDSRFGFHSQIIGYRIDVDGDSNIVILYSDDQNYDALTMPEVQFSQ